MADLELGGGKAVIVGDSRTQKTPALFEAFGQAVEDVGGKYWTAEDVGVSPADLMHARKRTRYVAGLEDHPAASGDPSPVTAERSEEHTSELQSLMRYSYAVFCLKKKTHITSTYTRNDLVRSTPHIHKCK